MLPEIYVDKPDISVHLTYLHTYFFNIIVQHLYAHFKRPVIFFLNYSKAFSIQGFWYTERHMTSDSFLSNNYNYVLVYCIINLSKTRKPLSNNKGSNLLIQVLSTDEWLTIEISKILISTNLFCDIAATISTLFLLSFYYNLYDFIVFHVLTFSQNKELTFCLVNYSAKIATRLSVQKPFYEFQMGKKKVSFCPQHTVNYDGNHPTWR